MPTHGSSESDGATAGDFKSKEGIEQVVNTLSAMKIKPKAESPADLLGWMTGIVNVGKESGAIPNTPIKTEFPKDSKDLTQSSKPPIRIAVFSGGRNDSSYELWRSEVTCLRKEGYVIETIMNAIKSSLKSKPANVMMQLGPACSIEEILLKFDSTVYIWQRTGNGRHFGRVLQRPAEIRRRLRSVECPLRRPLKPSGKKGQDIRS
jgi:hypothetical protein